MQNRQNRSDKTALRTLLPTGLGIVIGMTLGAVALANVNLSGGKVEAAPQANAVIVNSLSAQRGVSFVRVRNHDGERCFAAVQSTHSAGTVSAETICAH